MPVCLNCGKDIESGKNYCDDCGKLGEARVQEMLDLAAASNYRPRRTRRFLVLVVGLLLVTALLVVFLVILLLSFPSGPEFQAAACRRNLRRIEEALDDYLEDSGELPSAGPVDENHVLLKEGFLEEAPRCPATGRFYEIVVVDGRARVECDSRKKGHFL